MRKRTEKDIWQNLWEFILIEKEEKIIPQKLVKSIEFSSLFKGNNTSIKTSLFYKQQLTHQTIEGLFLYVMTDATFTTNGYTAVKHSELKALAFPRFITSFLEKKVELESL